MRKLGFYLLGLILVAAAAVAIVVAAKNSKSHNDNTSDSGTQAVTKKTPSAKDACSIFTLADAKLLLGTDAKGGENGVSTSSEDLSVSTCTYTDSDTPASTSQSATLLVRAPKTEKGITSNHNEFGPLKPTGVQDVPGYGDSAYWDAEHGQLNILKNNNWYILSNGPVTPGDRTLDQTTKLADILISKL